MSAIASSFYVHIIDDDESVRKGLSRLMRSAGFSSRTYDSAECFLAQEKLEVSGCILMDITMPHMSGLELAARLRQLGISLPVIAISARDDEETRQKASDLGVRFYLRKPVDDQALIDAINWVTRNDWKP